WATRRPILVATVTPSGASLARNCPMIRSLRPSPYTSAVSRKVTPDSTAARSTARASASVTAPQSAPSCQVPRPMTDTGLPVLPRTRCSMGSDPRGGIPRPRRRPYAGIVTRPSRGSRATVRGMEGRTPPAWARVALVMFAVGWGANQFSPMLIVYRRSLGLSAGEIAGLFAIYAATLIPGLLAGGPLSDRFGRRAGAGRGVLGHGVRPGDRLDPGPVGRRRAQRAPGGARDQRRVRVRPRRGGRPRSVGPRPPGGAVPAAPGARRRGAGGRPDRAGRAAAGLGALGRPAAGGQSLAAGGAAHPGVLARRRAARPVRLRHDGTGHRGAAGGGH